jgi:predicted O-methyltransferase YrrM
MSYFDPAIENYCLAHTSAEPAYLRELRRETHLKVLRPRMLSGPLQGRLLAMLCGMQAAQKVLEIGTYTGYSALCLAEGLAPGGEIHTLEANEELAPLAQRYFEEAGLAHCIQQHLGDAKEIIPRLQGPWDLVFIDADKVSYPEYWALIRPKLAPKGLLVADNVLWNGKVGDPAAQDKQTAALRRFNQAVAEAEELEKLILPFRDGLLLARRNS